MVDTGLMVPPRHTRYLQQYAVITPSGGLWRSCPRGISAGTKVVAGVKIRPQIMS
jgi:hypothetical protein